jgi:hypothetical protein
MVSLEEVAKQSGEQRLRLERAADRFAAVRARRPADWQRGGGFGSLGRFTVDYLLAVIAWHDDDHLDQLRRALEGRA